MVDELDTGFNHSDKRAYVHTLSLRLTNEQYRRLRRFVAAHEEKLGHRLTHQAVLETALNDYLTRSDTPGS